MLTSNINIYVKDYFLDLHKARKLSLGHDLFFPKT